MELLAEADLERVTAGKEIASRLAARAEDTLDAWRDTAQNVRRTSDNVNRRVDQLATRFGLQ